MIEARGLTKRYGSVLALDAIDLTVQPGRIVGFLGPNGAGKTTAIRILTCFMPATSGAATVDGYDVFTESKHVRRRIGYLPENTPLYPEMRVDEQLHHFGRLHGLSRPRRRQRLDELSDRCGLGAIRRRPIGQLSKGNRQRVGLAQAMLHDPPGLILDEPTAGLDPVQIAEVRRLSRDLSGDKTVLLRTHILPEVEKTCDEMVIISGGRIVAAGAASAIAGRAKAAGRVRLEVKAGAPAVGKALRPLAGVGRVHTDAADGWTIATIEAAGGAGGGADDLRERIGQAIAERGWAVRYLSRDATDLEALFMQLTGEAGAPGGGDPAEPTGHRAGGAAKSEAGDA
jgi:ABC-2 type transport system ATP-binding protein